jgi:hypothetical protein
MLSLNLPSFPTRLTSETIHGLNVCPEIAFADHKGKRKSGLEKKSRKLLEKLQAPLQKFVPADETVLAIFRAQSHVNGLQQYTMGLMVYGLTATVIVITDKRFLQLRTKNSNKWDEGIRVCRWQNVSEIKVKGWLGKEVILHFPDGNKNRVWKVPGTVAKVMKKLLPELAHAHHQGAAVPGGMVHICPECQAALCVGKYECPGCRLVFKNEKKMRWLALLPGAAYFYCKKPLLGVLDFIGEGYILLFFAIVTVGSLLSTETNPLDWQGLAVTGVVLLFILAIEVAVTIQHCAHFVRDFIPTKEHAHSPEQAYAASAGFRT